MPPLFARGDNCQSDVPPLRTVSTFDRRQSLRRSPITHRPKEENEPPRRQDAKNTIAKLTITGNSGLARFFLASWRLGGLLLT
jgi:hypothetical protein